MSMWRATFFFSDTNKHGWSETYYQSQQIDVDSVLNLAKTLADKRRAMLGTTAFLTDIRISDDLVKRDALLFHISPIDQTMSTFADEPTDSANVALLVRLTTLNLQKYGRIYMSGLEDGIVEDAGRFKPNPRFRGSFADWTLALVTDKWAVKNKSGTVPARLIASAAQNLTTGNVTITTGSAHGFAQGDPITLRNTGVAALNGNYAVLAGVTLTTFEVPQNRILNLLNAGGTASKIDMALYPITDAQAIRITHRNRGRPFDTPVGRRKARLLK